MTKADELRSMAAEAKDIVIIAPFVKETALRHVLTEVPNEARVTCITRWTIEDLLSGASDVTASRVVRELGGEFRLHPNLHAKYFRFSRRILVGSANVTRSGLGLSDTPNVEILCEPAESFDFGGFEKDIFDSSIIVSDLEAEVWETFVTLHTATGLDVSEALATSVSWTPLTREPVHVWLAYQGRESDIPSEDERHLAARDLIDLAPPEGLSRRQFDSLMGVHLLSSHRVADVRRVSDMADLAAWDDLGARWGVTRRDALRVRSTVENWLSALMGSM